MARTNESGKMKKIFEFLQKCVGLLRELLPEREFAEIESEYEKVMEEKRHSDKLRQQKRRHSDTNAVTVTGKKRHSDKQAQTPTKPETIGSVGFSAGQNSATFAGVGGVGGVLLLTNKSNDVTEDGVTSNIDLKEKNIKKRKETKENVAQDFEIFWKAYPRKIAKKLASRRFQAAFAGGKALTLDTLLKALETQKKSEQWQKDNGQYIPHPATWLFQERWNDETEPRQQAARLPLAPPTESEALAFAQSIGSKLGANFYRDFSQRNWMDFSDNPITDWKALFRKYNDNRSA